MTDASERAREVLERGTWAEVVAYLRTIKTEDEMVSEFCASPRTLARWEAGSKPRPLVEKGLRKFVAEWLGLTFAAEQPSATAGGEAMREAAARIADASAASSVPLMNGIGVAASVETGRHRAATEIAKAIRALPTPAGPNADEAGEVERLREALETIARSRYGLQGIAEDYGHDTNAYNYQAMKYWAGQALAHQNTARAALGPRGDR